VGASLKFSLSFSLSLLVFSVQVSVLVEGAWLRGLGLWMSGPQIAQIIADF